MVCQVNTFPRFYLSITGHRAVQWMAIDPPKIAHDNLTLDLHRCNVPQKWHFNPSAFSGCFLGVSVPSNQIEGNLWLLFRLFWAGGTTQQLGALADLPRVPGSIPSTGTTAYSRLWLQFQDSWHLFLPSVGTSCLWCRQKTHTHKRDKSKKMLPSFSFLMIYVL